MNKVVYIRRSNECSHKIKEAIPSIVDIGFFIGKEFTLYGVGLHHVEDAQAISINLDGNIYTAIEDPNDGYRSCLSMIVVNDRTARIDASIPGVKLKAIKGDNSTEWSSSNNDTVVFKDSISNMTVIEIGTNNTDDYYPSFVHYYRPENMSINEKALQQESRLPDNFIRRTKRGT